MMAHGGRMRSAIRVPMSIVGGDWPRAPGRPAKPTPARPLPAGGRPQQASADSWPTPGPCRRLLRESCPRRPAPGRGQDRWPGPRSVTPWLFACRQTRRSTGPTRPWRRPSSDGVVTSPRSSGKPRHCGLLRPAERPGRGNSRHGLVPIEAEVVITFGLLPIGLRMLAASGAMIGGGEVVVAVGIFRIGVNRPLKLPQGAGVLGLLVKPNPFRVSSLGQKLSAAGERQRQSGQQGHADQYGITIGLASICGSGCSHGVLASPSSGKREDNDHGSKIQERFCRKKERMEEIWGE